MPKNKPRLKQARQAKRAVTTRVRRETKKAAPAKKTSLTEGDVPESLFPEATQLFWLAHGVNCLLSDYKKGIWTPLFENIYTGAVPESTEIIVQAIMDRYTTRQWPPEVKAAVAWSVSSRKLLYIYWHEAMRRKQRAHPELDPHEVEPLLKKPAEALTWDLFSYLQDHLLQRKLL